MKKVLIAVLLAGAVFGIVIKVAPTREAEADVFTDIYNACASDWNVCYEAGKTAYGVGVWLWNWVDDAFTGVSYMEECLGEGCYTEEVRENHVTYNEECNNEGCSFEEIKETVFHDSHRASLNDMQEASFSLVMLKDFQRRGWKVRALDIQRAGG